MDLEFSFTFLENYRRVGKGLKTDFHDDEVRSHLSLNKLVDNPMIQTSGELMRYPKTELLDQI